MNDEKLTQLLSPVLQEQALEIDELKIVRAGKTAWFALTSMVMALRGTGGSRPDFCRDPRHFGTSR